MNGQNAQFALVTTQGRTANEWLRENKGWANTSETALIRSAKS
jgi:hypothetical protein